MIVSLLNTAFTGATDASMDYLSSALWEFNLTDSVEKPQTFWARPFIATDSFSKTGIKTTRVIANIFFLKANKFSDNQLETEALIDAMHDEMNKFYVKLGNDTTLIPTIKSIRYEDVYKFLDINYAGVSSIVEFEFTNKLC